MDKRNRGVFFALALLGMFVLAVAAQAWANDCQTTYDNFGKDFMQKYCYRCHSTAKANWFTRSFAPAGVDFDQVQLIGKYKDGILKMVVDKRTMPPTEPLPTAEERAKVKAWLECEYK